MERWKFLSIGLVVVVVLLNSFGSEVVRAAGPHEFDSPPCYGVVGKGKIVDLGNSGVLDFDFSKTYGLPALEIYEACVRVDGSGNPVRVEGWAWNTNLGWVSLYCSGGLNLGANCGAQNYGVQFSVSPGSEPFTNVQLTGYAWGDNVGYISFNCSNTSSCGTVDYKVELVASGAAKGVVKSSLPNLHYAWADSVQWFDLSGVRFPWMPLEDEELKICAGSDVDCTCNLAKGCVLVGDNVPVADGVDAIEIKLPFRQGGIPLNENQVEQIVGTHDNCSVNMNQQSFYRKEFGFCYVGKFFTNIDLDQTTKTSQKQVNVYTEEDRVVRAPGYESGGGIFSANDLYYYDPIDNEGYRRFKLRALAPTSNGNVDSQNGFNNEKFEIIGNNLIGDYDPTISGRNIFELEEMQFMLFKFSDGISKGECVVGILDGDNCNPIIIKDVKLPFRPPLSIDKMRMIKGNNKLNFIEANLDEDFKIEFDLKEKLSQGVSLLGKKVDLIGGLQMEGESILKFDFLQPKVNQLNKFDVDLASLDYPNVISGKIYESGDTDGTVSDFAHVKPFLYSVVSYTLQYPNENGEIETSNVKYFSGKLPMQKLGVLKNPVMSAVGSIFSSSNIFNKSASSMIRSLGAVTTNKFREDLAREAGKVFAGSGLQNLGNNEFKVTNFQNGEFVFDGGVQVPKVGKDVYFVKGKDLVFECSNDCKFDGKKTFVVEDGNVYINSNLMKNNDIAKLGLIVLRATDLFNRKVGNVYVEGDVTDLAVNIYADGAMMSYAKSKGISQVSGEPIFEDDYERQELLLNQLVFEGSLSSANCIGCASIGGMYDGYGLAVGGGSSYAKADIGATGRAKAKTYDLNYLRYYGPTLKVCADGVTIEDQQVKAFYKLEDPCNANGLNYEINATEIFNEDDQQSVGDLILINDEISGKRSKKFENDNTKFNPVIFIYRSAEGLPIFTREIDVNPVAVF